MAFFASIAFFLVGVGVGGHLMKFGKDDQKKIADRGWIELDGKVYRVTLVEVK